MTRAGLLFTTAGLAALTTPTLADVYIEVAWTDYGPDGADDLVPEFETRFMTSYSVWMWADEPGVVLTGIDFDVTMGTELSVLALGVVDPDARHAFLIESPGTGAGDRINNISAVDLPLPGFGYELPGGPAGAWLLYAGFVVNPGDFGLVSHGRVDAVLNTLTFAQGTAAQSVHLFGVQSYPEPTPGSFVPLVLASVGVGRRRR